MTPSLASGSKDAAEDPVALARRTVAGAKRAISRTNQAIARLSAASRAAPDPAPSHQEEVYEAAGEAPEPLAKDRH